MQLSYRDTMMCKRKRADAGSAMDKPCTVNVLQRHFCVSSGELLKLMHCADIKVPLMKQNKSFCNDFQTSFCQGQFDLALSLRQRLKCLWSTCLHLSALIVRSPNRFFSSLERPSEEVLLLDVISHQCVEYVIPTVMLQVQHLIQQLHME